MPSRNAQPAYQDTITDLFVRLGAPFHDTRRSWGHSTPTARCFCVSGVTASPVYQVTPAANAWN
ncbi:hypothetical protein D9M69_508130 [compost metagenome]